MNKKYTIILLVVTSSLYCFEAPTHKVASITDFGKRHFILGVDSKKIPAPKVQPIDPSLPFALTNDGRVAQVLFAPDDDVQKMLIDLIGREKSSIRVAIYMFTNGDIAKALLAAKERGIRVEIITDVGCMRDRFNKMKTLMAEGIDVFVYRRAENSKTIFSDIMHHKFALFGKNIKDRSLLWTGSFNFTKSAQRSNQENVVILDEPTMISKFAQQFNRLKKRCKKCRKTGDGLWIAHNEKKLKSKKKNILS